MPRPNTRERIALSSLELFNALGERSVSTNHIAASMEISPGNLYYHFANKQEIVALLFGQYESRVDECLRLPQARAATVEDMEGALTGLIEAIWSYRFFYRDLEHLLDSDPQLASRYQRFSQRCLARAQAIHEGLVQAGILTMRPHEVEAVTLNAWIVLTSWVRYRGVSHQTGVSHETTAALDEEMLKRGVYQVLTLLLGFVSPAWRDAVDALCERFYVPLDQVPVAAD